MKTAEEFTRKAIQLLAEMETFGAVEDKEFLGLSREETLLKLFEEATGARKSRSMSEGAANDIYDVLVEVCGAGTRERAYFVNSQLRGRITEWRFGGRLGFGGKFWRNDNRWYVNCYSEDWDEATDDIIESANKALAELKKKYPDQY